MIIDIHYHQIPIMPADLILKTLQDPIRAARQIGLKIDMEEVTANAINWWSDPDGEKLIFAMDESGVDFTLICAIDNASGEAITEDLVLLQNQMVGAVAQKYPDRVMALAGVDPRRPKALDLLKQCFEEFGMKGLKYHADYGYDPSGPESCRLLEFLEKNKAVLLSHTGPLTPPSRARFADPLLLADIGVDFPNVKVIAAHMGFINWRPWASLAAHQPNLYGDLAMWDTFALGRYPLFCRELRDIIDFVGVEKVLFGTDDPIVKVIRPTSDWINVIKNLPRNAPDGIRFTQDEVNAILGGNAQKLLGIG